MTGATSTSDGSSGAVPKPSKGDNSKVLVGDGTWKDISSLPNIASTTKIGMVKIGDNLSISSDGTLKSVNTWRGIQNNLNSTDTDKSLAAAQGKILNESINSKYSAINSKIGTTDISSISDGTITGAIDTLSNLSANRSITQAEYDALTDAEKKNGTLYVISDADPDKITASAVTYNTGTVSSALQDLKSADTSLANSISSVSSSVSALNESLTAKADKDGAERIRVTKDVSLDGYSFINAPFVAETTPNAPTPAGYGFHNSGSVGLFLYMHRTNADLRVHYNDNSDFALITERNNPAGAVLTAKWNGDVFSFTDETKTNIITLELSEGTWFVCGYSLVKMGDLWVNIPNASYEPTFARNGSGNGEMTLYSFGITQGGKTIGLCIQGNATIYPDIHFCGLLAYRIK